MKIITITNQKGGVAKTSTTINLSASLVKLGKKVLVIDMDPQSNTTSGLNCKGKFKKSIYDVLCDNYLITNAIIETEWKGISLIPSSIGLANAELELASAMGRETILSNILIRSELSKVYDYIIIDTNPSVGILTINALVAAEGIIIPMEPEIYSLEGMEYLLKVISLIRKRLNVNIKILGVLLTKVNNRTTITKDFEKEVQLLFPTQMFKTKINMNVKVQEAQAERMPILFYDEKAKASIQYLELAREIISHEQQE